MKIVAIEEPHLGPLQRFFAELPPGDATFIKEDVHDPDTISGWIKPGARARRFVALDGDVVVGLVAVEPLTGWSSHVGELRLAVHPSHRRHGVGRALAQRALLQALDLGLCKVTVEVVAEQEPAIRMFAELGFEGEALLRDQIRDRDGELRDLLVLAHVADDNWAAMATVGIGEEADL